MKQHFVLLPLLALTLLTSCDKQNDNIINEEDTTELFQKATSRTVSIEDLRGTWHWTGTFTTETPKFILATWKESYCKITDDSISFYTYGYCVDIGTGKNTSDVVESNTYPYTFTSPNIMHFNDADYTILTYNNGYILRSKNGGYVVEY